MKSIIINALIIINIIYSYSSSATSLELVRPSVDHYSTDTLVNFEWGTYDSITLQISIDSSFTKLYKSISTKSNKAAVFFPNTTKMYFWRIIDTENKTSQTRILSIINLKEIADLKLWVKADGPLIKDPMNKVSIWQDLSTNKNDLIQSDKNFQPTLIENQIGILPSIKLDGVNDLLLFNDITDIRTIFWVIKESESSKSDFIPILGHSVFNDFNRGQDKEIFSPIYSNPSVIGGSLLYNGIQKNTVVEKVPTIFSVISLITTGNTKANMFGSDRNLLGRNFNGDVAEIIIFSQPLADSNRIKVENYLMNKYAPPISLGKDTVITSSICKLTLGQNQYLQYNWSTGETTPTIAVNKSGTYALEVIDIFGRKSSDTINVTYLQKAPVLENAEYCKEVEFQLNTKLPNKNYFFKWNTGDQDSLLNVSQSGNYFVEILDKSDTNNCRITSNTVKIIRNDFSILKAFGNDTTLCNNTLLGVLPEATETAKSFSWSTGSTSNNISINQSGSYNVQITNDLGCLLKDTIIITIDDTKNAPSAVFSLNDTICAGQQYRLEDLSTSNGSNLVSRLWQFSDRSTNDSVQIKRIFADSGNVVVSLKVTAEDGCIGQLTKRTTVLPTPQPNFTFADITCMGTPISFSNTSKSRPFLPIQYNWNFNDPTSGIANNSILANPTFVYNTSGTFNPSLKLTDKFGCNATKVNSITIRPTPSPDFSFGTACQSSQLDITDKTSLSNGVSATSYFWNFGDGTTSSTKGSLSKTYGTSGDKNIILNVQTSNGCSKTVQKTATVIPLPQAVINNIGNCVGLPIFFADSSKAPAPYSISNRIWTVNKKAQGNKSSFAFTYDTVGTLSVQLQAFIGTCTATATKNISINPRPTAGFTIQNPYGNKPFTPVFSNTSVGFTQSIWNFKTGDFSSQNVPTYRYDTYGTFNVELIVKNTFGCADTANGLIYIYPDSMDVGVTSIDLIEENFGIRPRFELKNAGNKPINQVIISIYGQNSDATIYKEWTGVLLPGQSTIINLDVLLPLDTKKWQYVCVESNLVSQNDIARGNNINCKNRVEQFEFYDPYFENNNQLTLPFLIPSNDELEITIFDVAGKIVIQKKYEVTSGVLNINLPLLNLQHGIFNVNCQYQGQSRTKRFLKLE